MNGPSQVAACAPESNGNEAAPLWDLHTKPRFPVTLADWDQLTCLPTLPPLRVVGNHAYDLVVNRKARTPAVKVIGKLLRKHSGDFRWAAVVFEASQWRYLYVYLEWR